MMDDFPVRILLIGDGEQLLNLGSVLSNLPNLAIGVETAADHESGLRALKRHIPADVCLLDQGLPGPGGLEFVRQAVAQGCRTPLILLTASHDAAAQLEAIKAGAADCIRESIEAEALERTLRFAVERRRTWERLARPKDDLEAGVAERTAELSRANKLLAEADRRKDEFLAMLGHELRTPLAALAAAVELLTLKETDPAGCERLTGVLERQVRHLCRLVDDLLDLARILRGKIELRKQPVDLKDIVSQAIETTRCLLTSRRHHLHLSLPDQPLPVEADPIRLTQVFANLLNNAARFTREGGDVWVTVEAADTLAGAAASPASGPAAWACSEALVRIRDNGIGIPGDVLPRVFDLYVQANGPDRARNGLGVGLTLVRRLTRLHGGSVWAQSDGAGQGSEFVVKLPLLEPSPAAAASISRRAPEKSLPIPHHRLLLVDDNVDTAETMARLLRHLGQEVLVAHDGSGALDAARRFEPDIVFLDIRLPGLSGCEVASRLRQQPSPARPLLVALTGSSSDEDRSRSLAAGFDHYLIKPVRLKTLEKLLVECGKPGTNVSCQPNRS